MDDFVLRASSGIELRIIVGQDRTEENQDTRVVDD